MTKKIIGIAGNQLLQAAEVFHGNQVTYTPQGFVSAVQAAGGVPLVLPIGPKELAATYIQQIDKLLLAGGQDVAPEFYGQEPHIKLEETNRDRDEFELALIEEALKQNKPIFAVCRGMQLVNVALGAHYIKIYRCILNGQLSTDNNPLNQSLRRIVLMLNQTVNYQTYMVQLVKSTRTITKHYIL